MVKVEKVNDGVTCIDLALEESLDRIQKTWGGKVLNIFEAKKVEGYNVKQAFIIVYEVKDGK